jgi:hypothetical protein
LVIDLLKLFERDTLAMIVHADEDAQQVRFQVE